MAPDVSIATGWKMKRRPNSAYLVIFLTSAASSTDPAASAARIRFEDANVLTHVASQMRQMRHRRSQTPVRGPPSFSPHTSSSAATPTGSVHRSQTVSVVGMSGQLKRCNESWFGSLQSGQFAAGWLAGSILCR